MLQTMGAIKWIYLDGKESGHVALVIGCLTIFKRRITGYITISKSQQHQVMEVTPSVFSHGHIWELPVLYYQKILVI